MLQKKKIKPKGSMAPNEGLCIRETEDLEFSFDITK